MSLPRHQARNPSGFVIDPHNPSPPHIQLKEQLKLARTSQELKPGDTLPSIRALARELCVGDGVVRRAYRELTDVGFITTERRKHVVVTHGQGPASNENGFLESEAQCDLLIAWAQNKQVSAIALGRLLLRRALTREAASPSYLFVDICRVAAETSAARIASAWGISVAGVSVTDFTDLWHTNARRFSAVLVNQYLYEDVLEITGQSAPHVFSVQVRLDERLRRRITKLPPRSSVLLVCSDDDFLRTGRALLRHCEQVFGRRWRFQTIGVSAIPDLAKFIRTARHRLFLFSPLAWETAPVRIKRLDRVAPAFTEPNPQTLEEIRIGAGVLL